METSIGTPLVLNLGIFKSGTTSLQQFFKCNGWKASHNMDCGAERCSSALYRFLESRHWLSPGPHPVLTAHKAANEEKAFRQIMGPYDVHAELNHASDCSFPQVEHAEALVAALPGACFVVTSRPPEHFAHSVATFFDHYHASTANKSSLLSALLRGCTRRNKRPRNEADLVPWYQESMARCAACPPCAVRRQVDIEGADAGERLARAPAPTRRAGSTATRPYHHHHDALTC